MIHPALPAIGDTETFCQKVENEAAKHFQISVSEIFGSSRKADIVKARHTCIYLILKNTGISSVKLGRRYNRDHSSIVVAKKRIHDFLQVGDDSIVNAINALNPNF